MKITRTSRLKIVLEALASNESEEGEGGTID